MLLQERHIVEDLVERCKITGYHREFSLKLQLFDTLIAFNSANWYFEELKEQLNMSPSMGILRSDDYTELYDLLLHADGYYETHPLIIEHDNKYSKHVIDYLYPDEMLDDNRENSADVRLLIDKIQSDKTINVSNLKEGIKLAKRKLLDHLLDLEDLVSKKWPDEQYQIMANGIENNYTPKMRSCDLAYRYFMSWRNNGFDDPEEFDALLANELKKLFGTSFIIIDAAHVPRTYKKCKEELETLIGPEDYCDDDLKKFYILKKLVGFENGRFLFYDTPALGHYLYSHRMFFGNKDIEAFFYFKRICSFAYAELDSDVKPEMEQKARQNVLPPALPSRYTAFTMRIDGIKITEAELKLFLLSLSKNVKFALKDGLVVYDVMIIHGLTDATINRKTFVNDVNALAGLEVLSYDNCKNYDDLEFHKKIDEWRANEVTCNYYKVFDKFSKRQSLARSVEAHLLKLKSNQPYIQE